ncbi:MAG TPA: hypothetical protein VLM83_01750 [Anaerolineales bacterium]|nr:hypothetical protein [Anaerolineales bacterium]
MKTQKVCILILTVLVLASISCQLSGGTGVEPTSEQVEVVAAETDTPAPTITASPEPTETPVPTEVPTETPTPTEIPTETPTPTEIPQLVTVAQLEALLRDNGYTRQPFTGIGTYTDLRPGETGFSYTGDNWMEPVIVYEDGYVRFEVLNNLDTRASRMELKLEMLDELFPAEFMAELREAHEAYLETVGRGVTGTANELWPPPAQDFWSSTEGQYNVSNTTIGSYDVTFSLWFWQIECPTGYICWFPTFGNQVFLGQSSFVFYNIELWISP